MSEESILLSPEEVEKRKARKPKDEISVPSDNTRYINRGGRVEVIFESKGRFSAPEKVSFKDYTIEHVNDLTFSKTETILETLVNILNDLKDDQCETHVADFTLEEFMECLVAIKMQFNTSHHVHRWICDCQSHIEEDMRKINEETIDLNTIQYRSIEEADEIVREKFKIELEKASDEDFRNYLEQRYKDNPLEDIDSWTREDEIQSVTVQEPFHYRNQEDGNTYTFRMLRIGDIIDAQNKSDSKYMGQISAIQKKPTPAGTSIVEHKATQEKEIEKLKINQAKESVLMAKALTLIKLNGEDITDSTQKLKIYKQLTRQSSFEIADFLKDIEFGISDEREFQCPLCGKSDRRLLQQELNPIELLPLDTNTQRIKRESTGINVYFGS